MNVIGTNTGCKKCSTQAVNFLSPLRVGILLSLTLMFAIGSMSLYAGKPTVKLERLDAGLCAELNGTWDQALGTCTIGGGDWVQATTSIRIPDRVSLIIQGDGVPPESDMDLYLPCTFTLGFGFTLENQGLIRIETTGDGGFCNLGTLNNSGRLEVGNPVDGGFYNTGLLNAATINNSGTIAVQNGGVGTVGIFNGPHIPEDISPGAFATILPTITNSGNIIIENDGGYSTGILNWGALSNAGNITFSAAISGTYGLNNGGTFTNEASGTLDNFYGDVDTEGGESTYGIYNSDGTMINYGHVTNEAVIFTHGWAMLTYGTLDNYGVLYQSGGVLVNYGTVQNWGLIGTDGWPDYPHNQGVCTDMENGDGTFGSGCE
jgi:hypothetical protein